MCQALGQVMEKMDMILHSGSSLFSKASFPDFSTLLWHCRKGCRSGLIRAAPTALFCSPYFYAPLCEAGEIAYSPWEPSDSNICLPTSQDEYVRSDMNWIFTLLHTNARCCLYPVPQRHEGSQGKKNVYFGCVLMTVITAPFQKEGHPFNKHLLRVYSNG